MMFFLRSPFFFFVFIALSGTWILLAIFCRWNFVLVPWSNVLLTLAFLLLFRLSFLSCGFFFLFPFFVGDVIKVFVFHRLFFFWRQTQPSANASFCLLHSICDDIVARLFQVGSILLCLQCRITNLLQRLLLLLAFLMIRRELIKSYAMLASLCWAKCQGKKWNWLKTSLFTITPSPGFSHSPSKKHTRERKCIEKSPSRNFSRSLSATEAAISIQI